MPMQPLLRRIAPVIRAMGFRGSGQTYRKSEDDFVFVINFQGSRWGDAFYVNLGAQPTFIPAESDADGKKLKEYECVFRERVGGDWPWALGEDGVALLESGIEAAQGTFFGHVRTLPEALAVDSSELLLRRFCLGNTEARAALHLARAAAALGHARTARELVARGLELAGDAVLLRRALESVSLS